MKALKITILTAATVFAGLGLKAQTADEIFAKHYAAIGGDAWNKVNTMKMTSSMMTQGMEIGMTNTMVNNKAARTDMSVMGTNGYTIVTNNEGWSFMPMMGQTAPEAMKAEDLKKAQKGLDIKSQNKVDLKADITKAEVQGKEKVGDADCYKVKVTDKDNDEQTWYFDANTYYLVCVKAKQEMQGQSMDITQNYSDFKKLDEGIVVAMKKDVPGQASITFKSIEVNKPIDDAVFKPSK